VDSYRDLLGGSLEAYMSMVSNRLNDQMKQLTIIATVFLPLQETPVDVSRGKGPPGRGGFVSVIVRMAGLGSRRSVGPTLTAEADEAGEREGRGRDGVVAGSFPRAPAA
jgi:hypothetical protein